MLQKRIEPNFIIINLSFHNFKNVFCQNKSDLISKSSFFSLDFGHKSQSGVLGGAYYNGPKFKYQLLSGTG